MTHPMFSDIFDATQAFVGELSHFNMWDRVLRPIDISAMANCSAYMPGNVVPYLAVPQKQRWRFAKTVSLIPKDSS
ncbi:hypothetical protein M9458_007055, partial [Cirrhinus mrigala]